MRSIPQGSAAIVAPPARRAASWAMPSIPSANPLTTQMAALAAPAENSAAARWPSNDGFRVPTIDSVVVSRCFRSPRTNKNGGRSAHSARRAGYSGSCGVTRYRPDPSTKLSGKDSGRLSSIERRTISAPRFCRDSADADALSSDSGVGKAASNWSSQRASLSKMLRVSANQRPSASAFKPN